MSATANLSTPQFGSVTQGTYDVDAHRQWHAAHFRPVQQEQYGKIRALHTADVAQARDARERGDRAGAARALTRAASSRRMVQSYSHLKR